MGPGRRHRQVGRGDGRRNPRSALREGAPALISDGWDSPPRGENSQSRSGAKPGLNLAFAKLQALGNDFLVVERTGRSEAEMSRLARELCDRRCGVGADGVVYREPPEEGGRALGVRIFNADGSEAEMSGNGVRCVAALLAHERTLHDAVRIETLAGPKVLTLRGRDGAAYRFDCSMGVPILDPGRIPARVAGPGPITDLPLEVGGMTVAVTLSSMGNPHCSTFWAAVEEAPFEALGAALERHPAFPNRTNVEFIQVLDGHRLRVRFWERGVGPTLASGTGSCAAALAGMLLGRVRSPVTVETALGSLEVVRLDDGALSLAGPAEVVCTGRYRPEHA